ncbi:MAG: hypothetical protein ABIG61_00680 [Planctomycetota bacterium]
MKRKQSILIVVLLLAVQAIAGITTDVFDMTNGDTEANDLENLVVHNANYYIQPYWEDDPCDPCDLNAAWVRDTSPDNCRFGTSGVGLRQSTGYWGARFHLDTNSCGTGDYILRLENVTSNSSTKKADVQLWSGTKPVIETLDGETGTVDISFKAWTPDIVDGNIGFYLHAQGSEVCYTNKATLFYVGPDYPGEVCDEFYMTNGDTEASDLTNLIAHEARYYAYSSGDPCDPCDLNTAWQRSTSPHYYRFGSEGVGVRQASGYWGARFKLDPNGHGAGDQFILRLEGVNSNSSTRKADVIVHRQGLSSHVIETLDGETRTVDISFTLTVIDILKDGKIEIKFEPQGSETAYCGVKATLFYVGPAVPGDLTDEFDMTNGDTEANDLANLIAHEARYYPGDPCDANNLGDPCDPCDLNAAWQRNTSPHYDRFGSAGVGVKKALGWRSARFKLDTGGFAVGDNCALRLEDVNSDSMNKIAHVKINQSPTSSRTLETLNSETGTVDIQFTATADDISSDKIEIWFDPNGSQVATCGTKADLYYVDTNWPLGDLVDEFDLTNGDTDANDLTNLTAHDARYWTSVWMAAYEDACDLNAEWQRDTSPWHVRYGTSGIGIRESSGYWGASFMLDIGSYGAGDSFLLRLEDCYSNSSTRIGNVGVSYRHQGYGNVVGEINHSGTVDITFTLTADDISPSGDIYVCIFPKGGYCGEVCYAEKATLYYTPSKDFDIGFYYGYNAPNDNVSWGYALMDMARSGGTIVQELGSAATNEKFFYAAENWGIEVVPYHGFDSNETYDANDVNDLIETIKTRRDNYDSLLAGDNIVGYMIMDEPEDDGGLTQLQLSNYCMYVNLIHQYDPNRDVYVNHSDPTWYDFNEDVAWCTTGPVLNCNSYRIDDRIAHAVNDLGFDGYTMVGHAKKFGDWMAGACGSYNYYGFLGDDCDCSTNMDISFTLDVNDISEGGDTYVCFWPKPDYCGEMCYCGEKATLYYQPAAPNDPNNLDLTDEVLMVNGDTDANDLTNLTAHDARYWTSAWMAAYEDACNLNAEWERDTSPWHVRYGTSGVGIRESSGYWGASFMLDIADYGAGDDFILKLKHIYANSSTRTANVGVSYRHQGYNNKIDEVDGSDTYYDDCVYDQMDWLESRTNYEDVNEQTQTAYNRGADGIVYFIYSYYESDPSWSLVDCNGNDVNDKMKGISDAARVIRADQGWPGVELYYTTDANDPNNRTSFVDDANYPTGTITLEAVPAAQCGSIHHVVFGMSTDDGLLWDTTNAYKSPYTARYTLSAGETVIFRVQAVDTMGTESIYAANRIKVNQ